MKKTIRFFIFLMTITLIACQKDIPEPETKTNLVFAAELPTASKVYKKEFESFKVRYYVKGKDVFIECFISNFSFRNHEKGKKLSGKMLVYIDGKKYKEYSSAAFIMKDLKSGKHRVTLQLVNEKGHKLPLKKELMIPIP